MGIFAGAVLEDDNADSGTPNSPPDAPGIGVYGGGKNSRGIGLAGACDSRRPKLILLLNLLQQSAAAFSVPAGKVNRW